MEEQWYYAEDCRKYGPISVEELKGLLCSGKLPPTTLVRREDMQEWTKAWSVSELLQNQNTTETSSAPAPPADFFIAQRLPTGEHVAAVHQR